MSISLFRLFSIVYSDPSLPLKKQHISSLLLFPTFKVNIFNCSDLSFLGPNPQFITNTIYFEKKEDKS